MATNLVSLVMAEGYRRGDQPADAGGQSSVRQGACHPRRCGGVEAEC